MGEKENAYPTETKLAHDAPPTTRDRTPILDSSRTGVPSKSVELELCLVADLGRESLVASYVEVCSAGDFVCGYAFAGLDITEDSNFCHCHSCTVGECAWVAERMGLRTGFWGLDSSEKEK